MQQKKGAQAIFLILLHDVKKVLDIGFDEG